MVKIYEKKDYSYSSIELIEQTFRLKKLNYRRIESINESILRMNLVNNKFYDMIFRKYLYND